MPLGAIDTASLSTSLGIAIYLALIAGFRGEQIVFILFLRGRKVGPLPKTQARNTVSGGRKAESSISDSCFEKENFALHSCVPHVAPRHKGKITPFMACAECGPAWGRYQATSFLIRFNLFESVLHLLH